MQPQTQFIIHSLKIKNKFLLKNFSAYNEITSIFSKGQQTIKEIIFKCNKTPKKLTSTMHLKKKLKYFVIAKNKTNENISLDYYKLFHQI